MRQRGDDVGANTFDDGCERVCECFACGAQSQLAGRVIDEGDTCGDEAFKAFEASRERAGFVGASDEDKARLVEPVGAVDSAQDITQKRHVGFEADDESGCTDAVREVAEMVPDAKASDDDRGACFDVDAVGEALAFCVGGAGACKQTSPTVFETGDQVVVIALQECDAEGWLGGADVAHCGRAAERECLEVALKGVVVEGWWRVLGIGHRALRAGDDAGILPGIGFHRKMRAKPSKNAWNCGRFCV